MVRESEVAEVVAELALVALVDALDRRGPVLPERDGAGAPEPDGVGAVDVDQVERVEDVAERLRDLPVVEQQVAVDEELPRHFVSRREQHRGPEDAVEAEDVLRQQVAHRRPERRRRRSSPGRAYVSALR